MDLKIKDVADLLSVSETTVRRWLSDGRIPAYRINQQYRFSRNEIEDWVIRRQQDVVEEQEAYKEPPEANSQGGNKQFSLYRALHKGRLLTNVPGSNKQTVIRNAVKEIAKDLNLDSDVLTDLLLDREKLQPTALGNGIGIPHTRDFLLSAHYDVVAVVFPEKPLQYGSLDGLPVHTLFFLFACDDKRHLHLLAKIAHLSSQPEALKIMQNKPSKEKLLTYIKSWESQLHI